MPKLKQRLFTKIQFCFSDVRTAHNSKENIKYQNYLSEEKVLRQGEEVTV